LSFCGGQPAYGTETTRALGVDGVIFDDVWEKEVTVSMSCGCRARTFDDLMYKTVTMVVMLWICFSGLALFFGGSGF
jgi:hypothetical protein